MVNKAQPQPQLKGYSAHAPALDLQWWGNTKGTSASRLVAKASIFTFWIFAIFGDFSEFIVFPLRFPFLSICIFWIFIFPDFCKTSGLFSLGFFGWFSLLVILWFFGDLFELFIFPLCLPLLWYVFSRFSCSRFLWGLTLFSLGFFGWFSLLVICKFLVMFLNSLFFLCVSLYLWYVFFWVFIFWFLWRFRVFSLSFLFIFNSGEFFHFYNFDFFFGVMLSLPPVPPNTMMCGSH